MSQSFERAPAPPTTTASSGINDHGAVAPVDVDMNLVMSLLESYSRQEGLPGPVSNILGAMEMNRPRAPLVQKGGQ